MMRDGLGLIDFSHVQVNEQSWLNWPAEIGRQLCYWSRLQTVCSALVAEIDCAREVAGEEPVRVFLSENQNIHLRALVGHCDGR